MLGVNTRHVKRGRDTQKKAWNETIIKDMNYLALGHNDDGESI